eukprot:2294952-Prymnesium_polylepis.1
MRACTHYAHSKDNSGDLSISEVEAVLTHPASTPRGGMTSAFSAHEAKVETAKIFARFDVNKNGTLQYGEFVRWWDEHCSSRNRKSSVTEQLPLLERFEDSPILERLPVLSQRFPHCPKVTLIAALSEAGGHAGKAILLIEADERKKSEGESRHREEIWENAHRHRCGSISLVSHLSASTSQRELTDKSET